MQSLEEVIRCLEPRIDLLHDCLGFGRFAAVTVTTDGHFLGRDRGDIGFNQFLGSPSQAAMARTQELFSKLSSKHQQELISALIARQIPPQALGIPSGKSVGEEV